MKIDTIIKKFTTKFDSTFVNFDNTRLNDLLAGYSIRGSYPSWMVKKLKITSGKHYIPFLYFYLDNELLKIEKFTDINNIPLVVKVDFLLETESFFNEGIAYSYNNDFVGNKFYLPINFITSDEFFYDFRSDKFFKVNNSSQELTLLEIYNQVMRLHIAKYSNIVGLKARSKVFIKRQFPVATTNLISFILGLIHWIIVGVRYTYDPIMAQLKDERKEIKGELPPPIEEKEIDFFGYKVSAWTLGSYSFLVLSCYVGWHFSQSISPKIVKQILENNYLSILFAILSMLIYDKISPPTLKRIIRRIKNYELNKQLAVIKLSV